MRQSFGPAQSKIARGSLPLLVQLDGERRLDRAAADRWVMRNGCSSGTVVTVDGGSVLVGCRTELRLPPVRPSPAHLASTRPAIAGDVLVAGDRGYASCACGPVRVSAPRGVALLCARKRPRRLSVRAVPAPSPVGEAGAHTRPRERRRTALRLPKERSRADAFPKVPSLRHRRSA